MTALTKNQELDLVFSQMAHFAEENDLRGYQLRRIFHAGIAACSIAMDGNLSSINVTDDDEIGSDS